MVIGISTASIFSRCAVENTPPLLRTLGAEHAEVFLNTYSEYDDPILGELAGSCRDAGVSVYSVHPMSLQFEPQLFSVHPRQQSDALRVYEKVLNACRVLGATHYVMHGAAVLSNGAQNLRVDRLAPKFSDLCRMAEDAGVTLCLENVSWCMLRQPSFALDLQQAMGSHALKFCLDVKQSIRSGVDPAAFVDALGTDIANIHLCDYATTSDGFIWRMPGQGEYDFTSLAKKLKSIGYRGGAFLEVYNNMYEDYSALANAFKYIKSIFDTEEQP